MCVIIRKNTKRQQLRKVETRENKVTRIESNRVKEVALANKRNCSLKKILQRFSWIDCSSPQFSGTISHKPNIYFTLVRPCLLHCRIKIFWKALAMVLFTIVRITDITFVPGLNSTARLASPKTHTTASSTKSDVIQICSPTISSSLADDEETLNWFLKAGCSSDMGRSTRPSNLSSLFTLGIGVANFFITASNKCGRISGFRSAFTELYAVAIKPPSWSINSVWLTAVTWLS